jgi:hypothetical protein
LPILGFRTTGCELSSWSADVRCEARTHLVGEENRDLALFHRGTGDVACCREQKPTVGDSASADNEGDFLIRG